MAKCTFNFLDSIATINNKDICCKVLRESSKALQDKKDAQIALLVNSMYTSKNDLYFDSSFNQVGENSTRKYYRLLNTGYKNHDGKGLYLSCTRGKDGWQGAFTGCVSQIRENVLGITTDYSKAVEHIEDVTISSDETTDIIYKEDIIKKAVEDKKLEILSANIEEYDMETTKDNSSISNEKTKDFYIQVYNNLLTCRGWDLDTPALKGYIEVLITRLNWLLQDGYDVSKYLRYNTQHTLAMFNTALIDKYGKNMLVVSKIQNDLLTFTNLYLVCSKVFLVENGFVSNDDRKLERVSFGKKENMIFDAEIQDFDLYNYDRLTHCIVERRSRFPKETEYMSDNALCQDMISAIELGVRLSKCDVSYVKPTYNCRYNTIQFIIPYHVSNNFDKEPELGIVVSKYENGLWGVMTVLGANECRQDLRVLNLYNEHSF